MWYITLDKPGFQIFINSQIYKETKNIYLRREMNVYSTWMKPKTSHLRMYRWKTREDECDKGQHFILTTLDLLLRHRACITKGKNGRISIRYHNFFRVYFIFYLNMRQVMCLLIQNPYIQTQVLYGCILQYLS